LLLAGIHLHTVACVIPEIMGMPCMLRSVAVSTPLDARSNHRKHITSLEGLQRFEAPSSRDWGQRCALDVAGPQQAVAHGIGHRNCYVGASSNCGALEHDMLGIAWASEIAVHCFGWTFFQQQKTVVLSANVGIKQMSASCTIHLMSCAAPQLTTRVHT
jgi:hypothetical protein